MRLSPKYNVGGGVADLWNEIRRPQPYRVPILLASCALPGAMLYILAQERSYVTPAPPEVVYITTFAPDRTDAEIIAANKANQERKEARERLEREVAERKRELYRTLGEATGIDTAKMEAEIAAERAREQAALQAQAEAAGIGEAADATGDGAAQ